MLIEMLKLGATYYHLTHYNEIDQPHTIGFNGRMDPELTDSWAKDTFPSDLRKKISETDFGVMDWALIKYVSKLSVECIFNHIVLFLRRGVNRNKANVIKFCRYADCGYSM